MGKLDGQVVIITGASAGIGEATARMLGRQGARLVLTARRQDRLNVLKQEIESAQTGGTARAAGTVLAIAGDVTSASDRERLVQETMRVFGRIDALVNNAGYGQRGPIEIVPVDDIRRNFETNVFSLIALTQLAIPIMRSQRSGRIVNISSVAGRIARPLSSVYDATKHALEAISDGMRGELAPFGIKVIVIEPGFIITEFLEVANSVSRPVVEQDGPYAPFLKGLEETYSRARGIAGKPEDIARLVLRALASGRPRIRYAGPAHARLFLALNRVLPQRLKDYAVARQTGVTARKLFRRN
jgi:NAD(P)-dependent dehydrogenase (short-subunit alcohol dehydrogenase family)